MTRGTTRKAPAGLSDRAKWSLMIGAICVLVIGGGWWAYFKLTTIPPPPLTADTKPEKVVAWMGNSQGIARMPTVQREQYLAQVYQQYGTGPARTDFVQAMNRMSSGEKQVLFEATFDIAQMRVIEAARKYNNMPISQRSQFVDSTIRQIESVRGGLVGPAQRGGAAAGPGGMGAGGPGGPGGAPGGSNIGNVMKDTMPTGADELNKILVSRTNGQERAEAQPFVDSLASRYKQLQQKPGALQQLLAGR